MATRALEHAVPAGTPASVRPARHRTAAEAPPTGRRLATLSLAALGVVFGDIGTSPLYAFRECFNPEHGLVPTPATVYGVLSLIIWSLVLIVSVKYLLLIMRLDNRGEGGILALLALILQTRRRGLYIVLGLFGAALLYGDGIITPAISVLGATEGLGIATPAVKPFILPATVAILLVLFLVQRYGTTRVGVIFGPVMLVWFATIGVLGVLEIARAPAILLAVNPVHGVRFFLDHGRIGFLALGAVVLAVTGAEALYADMGHFGRKPIRLVWFTLVFPALLLNYFGQGALVLRSPDAVENPFYLLAARWFLYPLVAIATLAAIVASQALISGAFSLTQQSMQLRYSPRMSIVHTSRSEVGQIYMPEVNIALMVGCLLLVVGFRTSSALGAAYGIAVTGTMAITTALFYVIARHRWGWSVLRAGVVAGVFIAIDLAFLAANAVKITHGGWFPLVLAGLVFLLMITWKRGTDLVGGIVAASSQPLDEFLRDVERLRSPRVPGTAVFLTPNVEGVPPLLLHHLRFNKALHEQVVLLSIVTEEVPEVEPDRRVVTERLPLGFFRVHAYYGFMERPDVQAILRTCCDGGVGTSPEAVTYYLGHARLVLSGRMPMMRWRKWLYSFMARNASAATDFFNIPPDRVVELGARIQF